MQNTTVAWHPELHPVVESAFVRIRDTHAWYQTRCKVIDRVDDFCDREAGALLSVIASGELNIDKMIIKLENMTTI